MDGRLDAKYYCSPGVIASERMVLLKASGAQLRSVAGNGGLGYIDPPSRTKRVYAAVGEDSVPYLRPYDVFDYLPRPADLLSRKGSSGFDRLMPKVGTILQTCSGRNLGPLAYADAFISRFVVSDDMLRLHIDDETDRLYALAFLSTPTGQALLTRSKTGNVIDHLSANDFGAVEIPFIDDALTASVVDQMRASITLRENARILLNTLIAEAEAALSVPERTSPLRNGWTQRAGALGNRLDSALYDPYVATVRSAIKSIGGIRVEDVSEAFMLGIYKRYYVERGHGEPILSGRQLLQLKPINLQYVAARSLDFATYSLESGMIVFGARGRAEERLAQPALITDDRSGWLASHNVIRVRPKPGVDPGWLYLALAMRQVQMQIKARAFGSVVDVITPADLNGVLLPLVDEASGKAVFQCWRDFETANALETDAVMRLENTVLRKAGVR